jgi:four helix bundle protein
MAAIRSHHDLVVWQKGVDLVEIVYSVTRSFPPEERYGLTSQSTRAALSVPANIAEGHSRGTRREYANFIAIARGSLMELETYMIIARRLGYLHGPAAESTLERIDELSRMLFVLRARLTG